MTIRRKSSDAYKREAVQIADTTGRNEEPGGHRAGHQRDEEMPQLKRGSFFLWTDKGRSTGQLPTVTRGPTSTRVKPNAESMKIGTRSARPEPNRKASSLYRLRREGSVLALVVDQRFEIADIHVLNLSNAQDVIAGDVLRHQRAIQVHLGTLDQRGTRHRFVGFKPLEAQVFVFLGCEQVGKVLLTGAQDVESKAFAGSDELESIRGFRRTHHDERRLK